jgi:RNA polymerase sigma-70 factor, ECF subfamily|tara:strand:- start:278568 stop:279077 length:510 start_codon:yes stop_codon:yes gene_type:complete
MENTNDTESACKDFESLFQEYSDVIYRLCLYKTSNEQVAADLTQETFLRLWKTMCSSNEVEKPKQYLYQIARNLIIDHYKSKKTASLDMLQEEGFDPVSRESTTDAFAEVSIITNAIEDLDQEFRDVVYMRCVEGLRVKDIAETLCISENLVSVRLNRGRKKLQEKFTL